MTLSVAVSLTPDTACVDECVPVTMTLEVTEGSLFEGDLVSVIPMQKAAKIWPISQFTAPWEPNYTTVSCSEGARVALRAHGGEQVVGAQKYGVTVAVKQGALKQGAWLRINFGDRTSGSPGMHILSTAHTLCFKLTVTRPDGTCQELRDKPCFRVTPAAPAKIKVIAPSIMTPGERNRFVVHTADALGNVTGRDTQYELAPVEGVEISPVRGREPDEPADDSSAAYELTLGSDVGYRELRLHARANHLVGTSNPVKIVSDDTPMRIFWGDLHAHSNLGQGMESPDFLYTWAKQVERLDFIAHVEHDAAGDISVWVGDEYKDYAPDIKDITDYIDRTWELRKQLVCQHNQDGQFVGFLGFEWASNIYGHMNVIYRNDDCPIFYPKSFWQKDFDPNDLWKLLENYDAVTIPHHCSTVLNWAYASGTNWDFYNQRFMRNVEIYSKWGCSEYYGAPRAPIYQYRDSCVMEGLRRGHRFGFVGGSDSHASRPGSDLVESGWDGIHRQSGLTALYATQLTRDALFDALVARRGYATTGARMIIEFGLGNHPMGSALKARELDTPRAFSFDVVGTDALARVDLIKNGLPIFSHNPRPGDTDRISLTVPDHAVPTTQSDFYYLRVIQADGAMGWASPIFIDNDG